MKIEKLIDLINVMPLDKFKESGITKYRIENLLEHKVIDKLSKEQFDELLSLEPETKFYCQPENEYLYIFYYWHDGIRLFSVGIDNEKNKFLKAYSE